MRRTGIPPWTLAALVCVQVAVPLVASFSAPPARFGFQMYSGAGGTSAHAYDASGRQLRVDVGAAVANFRSELDWTRRLPEALCARVPHAARVEVHSHGHTRTIRCGR